MTLRESELSQKPLTFQTGNLNFKRTEWNTGDVLGSYDMLFFTDRSMMVCIVGAGVFLGTPNRVAWASRIFQCIPAGYLRPLDG